MKLKTALFTFFVSLVRIIFIPLLLILLNEYFNLPVYVFYITRIMGFILILIGVILFFYCSHLFSVYGKGTPLLTEPTLKFVSRGIYNYTRNPMYIGYFLILLGEFFILGYLLLLFYVFIYILFIHFVVVHYEEPRLRKKFGSNYIKYAKKVPRWIFI
jgi:protein-S-isoprenylcysteine O-methyltransferase Ste14